MENARILEERLKRIIREISSQTGNEIRQNLLQELEKEVTDIIHRHSEEEVNRFLNLLKKAINQI
ncbi:hypothetical protein SAMN02745218_02114 [Desulfofundulus australicus DSM 11792]|uniref:Uncharacterized protein n=1 Tax=Desulfofundulus australicus DSM 11792 TaxID=1121425 RepID=A0A1M5B7G1_9FIRM|nr:hypothetical protein [Desulfofundulus australicus]SHF38481.1 hypothetical protein SAMN02745218_02114 [Desulfofundulus australicus DSM 11792]